VCLCNREREREGETDRQTDTGTDRHRQTQRHTQTHRGGFVVAQKALEASIHEDIGRVVVET